MRKTYCYLCGSRLWGKKPMPDYPFTMGHCYQHGWVPDHEGLQILSYSFLDLLISGFRSFLKILDSIFGFFTWILRLGEKRNITNF